MANRFCPGKPHPHLVGFHSHRGTPIAGWFIMENPNWTWMMTGGTSILGNLHVGWKTRQATLTIWVTGRPFLQERGCFTDEPKLGIIWDEHSAENPRKYEALQLELLGLMGQQPRGFLAVKFGNLAQGQLLASVWPEKKWELLLMGVPKLGDNLCRLRLTGKHRFSVIFFSISSHSAHPWQP